MQDPNSQAYFEHVVIEAVKRGMTVNDAKTGLLCFSAAKSFTAGASLCTRDGGQVSWKETLKVFGFTFDSDAGCSTHEERIAARMRSRSWALQKLKRYGFSTTDLISIYTSYMRPLVEYVSVVWHSMLTAEQSAFLEKQQTLALRNIFGYRPSAAKMRSLAGIDLLQTRRVEACKIFANKALSNP